ncbi:hypothetical protein CY34DRAFT_755262 [Suillus luteus UH-Slu-Lm8-n1]|uniref:Uncharacterized protein n=1 Tax=Suillus luteus UH-Slu-Lm8-n1 TaxID=930992 RepID=A0A0D0AY85_9AGAM|nr:hypothetical protein CY34DRAFT_755262 [Suillus luteus UH-Slu-Lm8-n1]
MFYGRMRKKTALQQVASFGPSVVPTKARIFNVIFCQTCVCVVRFCPISHFDGSHPQALTLFPIDPLISSYLRIAS